MKTLVAIGGVVVALLVAIIVLTNMSNKDKLKSVDNPYGDKDLQQPTIDLLTDENYQHITLPEDLKEKIASGEEVNAYFFSPTCTHCGA